MGSTSSTRSKAITYDNLALRAPEFVRLADKLVARDAQAQGFDAYVMGHFQDPGLYEARFVGRFGLSNPRVFAVGPGPGAGAGDRRDGRRQWGVAGRLPDGSRVEKWTSGQVNPFGLAWDRYGNLYSADYIGSGTFIIKKPKRNARKRRQSKLKGPKPGMRK